MDPIQAHELITGGETLSVEFKGESRKPYSDTDLVEAVSCLANGEGGVLLLGVEDDGTITGARPRHGSSTDPLRLQALIANRTIPPLSARVTVLEIEPTQVVAIEVEESSTPVGTNAGTYKRRAMQADGKPQCVPYPLHEMLSKTTSTGQSDYAQLRVHGATWDDLDPMEFERFRTFARRSSSDGDHGLAALDDVEIARALGVVSVGSDAVEPLMGALLLFGRPQALSRFAPTHEAAFQVLRGTKIEINETVTGGLLRVAEELYRRFEVYNREQELDAGLVRLSIPLVPAEAVREAIANALVHRDYTMMGAIRVQLSDDALTITSPGGFPQGVRLDNLLDDSRPRSRTLADAFKRAGLVERSGRGIPRMFESTLRVGRAAPDFTRSTNESVVAVFPITEADASLARYVIEQEQKTGRPSRLADLQVLHELRQDGAVTALEAAELLQKTEPETRSALARMIEDGVVEARGTGRGRTYHLSAAVYRALGSGSAYVRVRSFDPIQQRQMILNYVDAHGRITRSQAAELSAISPTQASSLLRTLVQSGDLELRGERRGAHYIKATPVR
ncbi:MAG: putative DNA binding domain-containing protein [Actinomycetales bacterium]|nr:putative DNA binding domain-containing protein [Actinomycetales bacterium]